MNTLTIALVLSITTISALYWGAVLSMRLPEIDSRFDRKPFNCRPCATFHIAWLLSTFFATIGHSPTLFFVGLAVAFTAFAIVKIMDNKKIEK